MPAQQIRRQDATLTMLNAGEGPSWRIHGSLASAIRRSADPQRSLCSGRSEDVKLARQLCWDLQAEMVHPSSRSATPQRIDRVTFCAIARKEQR